MVVVYYNAKKHANIYSHGLQELGKKMRISPVYKKSIQQNVATTLNLQGIELLLLNKRKDKCR